MAKRLTTEQFIEEARKIHGDKYDYSKAEYVNAKTNVRIICPKHGEFLVLPKAHLNGKGCQECVLHSFSLSYFTHFGGIDNNESEK